MTHRVQLFYLATRLISLKVFLQSFRESQIPHKSVNLLFILEIVIDRLTDLWGSSLLQTDFKNTCVRQKQHTPSSLICAVIALPLPQFGCPAMLESTYSCVTLV
jgi:hypothetical protein